MATPYVTDESGEANACFGPLKKTKTQTSVSIHICGRKHYNFLNLPKCIISEVQILCVLQLLLFVAKSVLAAS